MFTTDGYRTVSRQFYCFTLAFVRNDFNFIYFYPVDYSWIEVGTGNMY